jgi:hypothetical protein
MTSYRMQGGDPEDEEKHLPPKEKPADDDSGDDLGHDDDVAGDDLGDEKLPDDTDDQS